MSLIIREMQSKTVKYYLTPDRMFTNKSINNKCLLYRRRNPCALLVRKQTGAWKIVWSFLKKQKMELSYDPVIPLWVYFACPCISKETQNTNSEKYMHPYVHYSIIYNSQNKE